MSESRVKPAIQCKYSCFKCGIYRQIVTVPQRDSEDVVEWLELTCASALCADHDRRSPMCFITKLSEVLVPVPEGTERVGALPSHPPPLKRKVV